MRLLPSILLACLLLTGFVTQPGSQSFHTQDPSTLQAHFMQQDGQPKHRGSGRRELYELAYKLVV